MTIADIVGRGKELLTRIPPRVLIVAILVLSTSMAFLLGILAGMDLERARTGQGGAEASGFWIEDRRGQGGGPAAALKALPGPQVAGQEPRTGSFVASKSGTKYYLPTCSGAGRIQESNKVWFASREEAESAGYTKAANCPGL